MSGKNLLAGLGVFCFVFQNNSRDFNFAKLITNDSKMDTYG